MGHDGIPTEGTGSRQAGGEEQDRPPLPPYGALPLDPAKPPRSAWGLFGEADQLGTLNLLTPHRVRHAAGLVRRGAVFALNWSLEKPDPPLFGRRALRHAIHRYPDGLGTDDHYDGFYPQASSQWDALCHVGHPQFGFYNGCTLAQITGQPGSRNGIDAYARTGIAGRFVLADVERYRRAQGRPVRPDTAEAIGVEEVEATLAAQGVALAEGDILLLRFGWIAWYDGLDPAARTALAAESVPVAVGLAPHEATAAWLWDRHVAAVAADNPALEVMPSTFEVDTFLHFRLLGLLGLAIGEMFDLEALAADCAADGVYEGLFTAAPLHKVGGSGSPANALAIK
jgi:kynurenine formamidase